MVWCLQHCTCKRQRVNLHHWWQIVHVTWHPPGPRPSSRHRGHPLTGHLRPNQRAHCPRRTPDHRPLCRHGNRLLPPLHLPDWQGTSNTEPHPEEEHKHHWIHLIFTAIHNKYYSKTGLLKTHLTFDEFDCDITSDQFGTFSQAKTSEYCSYILVNSGSRNYTKTFPELMFSFH